MRNPLPSFKEMNDWVRYDPETGHFFRREDAGRWYKAGDQVKGTINNGGYIMLGKAGRPISAARKLYLGYFATPEAAFEAYKKAAKQHHGEFRSRWMVTDKE